MKDTMPYIAGTKNLIGIIIPLVATLFFFFSLKSGVETNAERVQENRVAIEKMEIRMENMNTTLQETNTNVKLLQLQLEHMTEKMGELVTAIAKSGAK